MIQASKIIGTGLATTGPVFAIGAGVGIGVVCGAYILGFYYFYTTGIFHLNSFVINAIRSWEMWTMVG